MLSISRSFVGPAVLSIILMACSSAPPKDSPVIAQPSSQHDARRVSASMDTEAAKISRIVKILSSNSIYFDYDKFDIKPEYRTILVNDYQALKEAPNLMVMVEGNADERGSREYNLALGQKRAEAVKRALKLLGVPESQLEAVSYGSEKPRADCHEDKCWAENRRVDLAQKSLAK